MFYIYDCNKNIIGNAKGYKTVSSALSAINNRNNKLYSYLYGKEYENENIHLKNNGLFQIYSIKRV